jgi:hypothetical protein
MSVAFESERDSVLVEGCRVEQLRAVFWSMRKVIDAARLQASGARALLFELGTLAEAGISLADCAIDEASQG